jgi:hypothetical protein
MMRRSGARLLVENGPDGGDGGLISRALRFVSRTALPLTVVLIVGRTYLSILNSEAQGVTEFVMSVALDLMLLGFVALGLLVVHRRPGNPVGWIIAGIGVTAVASEFLQSYGLYALFTEPGRLPGGELMALLSTVIFIPVLFAAPAMLFLLFPDGNLPGRRWRVVFWLVILTTCSTMVSGALDRVLDDAPFKGVENPLSVDLPRAIVETLSYFGWPGMAASLLLAALAMILRLRRSRGVERQQLKWISAAAAVLPLASAAGVICYYLGYETVGGISAFAFVPVIFAAGYAVLRYRLYDIDVVINRTLVYGSLTVMLALVYFGGVAGLQRLLAPVTGQDSQLAIVASTLAIAALFNPLRRRIQDFVDRRFYRNKYDAARVLEAFSARLRDETDLDRLNGDLMAVVRETVQPAHVSLWLRPSDGGGRR